MKAKWKSGGGKDHLPHGQGVRLHGGDDLLLPDFDLSNIFAYHHYFQKIIKFPKVSRGSKKVTYLKNLRFINFGISARNLFTISPSLVKLNPLFRHFHKLSTCNIMFLTLTITNMWFTFDVPSWSQGFKVVNFFNHKWFFPF
jgi:hypothetical protein